MKKCVALRKRSKQNIPYILKCSKCRKGISAAINTWFERGHVTIKQSLGQIYSCLHHMMGQNATDEMEVNKKDSV